MLYSILKRIGNFLQDEKKYLDRAGEVYELFTSDKYKNQFDWIRSEFFNPLILKLLVHDSSEITKILRIGQNWEVNEDRKLSALYNLN